MATFGGFQVGPFQRAFQQVVVETGGGFWEAFERVGRRRKRRLEELEEQEQELQQIKDETDREIALLLKEQERQETEEQERSRLAELARRYTTERSKDLFGDRIAKAMARAAVQGNFSAIEAFLREVQKAQEEELFLINATIIMLEEDGSSFH